MVRGWEWGKRLEMSGNEVGGREIVRIAGEDGNEWNGGGYSWRWDVDTVTVRLDTWKRDGTGIRMGIRIGKKLETE